MRIWSINLNNLFLDLVSEINYSVLYCGEYELIELIEWFKAPEKSEKWYSIGGAGTPVQVDGARVHVVR